MWRKICRKGREILSGDYQQMMFLIANIEPLVPVLYFLPISELLSIRHRENHQGILLRRAMTE